MTSMLRMPVGDPSQPRRWSKKYVWALGAAAILGLLVIFASTSSSAKGALHKLQSPSPSNKQSHEHPSKYAYCIFLSDEGSENQVPDNYFIATRILLYQLIHAPETSSFHDVIVAVTQGVSQKKRERIRKDGAKLVELEPVDIGWVHASEHRYDSVMQKFRIWQMTQYERILILDSDIVLQANMDGVFEQGVVTSPLNRPDIVPLEHEAPYPTEYLLAGEEELDDTHKYPPQGAEDLYLGGGYLNAGFMLLKPSEEAFQYYMSLTQVDPIDPKTGNMIFKPEWPEQNLLNYVHRWDGPMPWQSLDPLWMLHSGKAEDLKQEPKAIHGKFWMQFEDKMTLKLEPWKWRMEGFWEGREGND